MPALRLEDLPEIFQYFNTGVRLVEATQLPVLGAVGSILTFGSILAVGLRLLGRRRT